MDLALALILHTSILHGSSHKNSVRNSICPRHHCVLYMVIVGIRNTWIEAETISSVYLLTSCQYNNSCAIQLLQSLVGSQFIIQICFTGLERLGASAGSHCLTCFRVAKLHCQVLKTVPSRININHCLLSLILTAGIRAEDVGTTLCPDFSQIKYLSIRHSL